MFTVTDMMAVRKGINQRWESVALTQYKVFELFQVFRKIILTARVEMEITDVYIEMDQFAPRYADYQHTLVDMFIELNNNPVTIKTTKPLINHKHVAWNDAFRAGYQTELWDRLNGLNTQVQERKDALLTRQSVYTSYKEVVDYCLVTVNGYYHYADTDTTTGVVVYDAAQSLRNKRSNQIGLLSFKPIGKIKAIPITDSMILSRQPTTSALPDEVVQPFKSTNYIKIPVDVTNKTVLLVFGGYLITPDMGFYKQVGDAEFFIDFDKYPMVDRYYDSLEYLDLSSIPLSKNEVNDSQRILEELRSEVVLRAFLKLSQTFFVVVDTPSLYVQTTKVQQVVSSGIYRIFKDSNLPMLLSNGRMPEYWKTKYDNMITLTVNHGFTTRRAYHKARQGSLNTVISTGLSNGHQKPADAFLMEIGVDYQEVPL